MQAELLNLVEILLKLLRHKLKEMYQESNRQKGEAKVTQNVYQKIKTETIATCKVKRQRPSLNISLGGDFRV